MIRCCPFIIVKDIRICETVCMFQSENRLKRRPITALHFHHCIELGICLEGEGETIIENKIFSFKKGDYQVIGANVAHLAHAVGVEQCVWLWIYVDYQDLEFKLGGLSFPKTGYNGILEKSKYPKLSEIIDNIVYNNDCDDQYSAMENALLVAQLLIELSRIGNVHNIGSNRVSSKIAPYYCISVSIISTLKV